MHIYTKDPKRMYIASVLDSVGVFYVIYPCLGHNELGKGATALPESSGCADTKPVLQDPSVSHIIHTHMGFVPARMQGSIALCKIYPQVLLACVAEKVACQQIVTGRTCMYEDHLLLSP